MLDQHISELYDRYQDYLDTHPKARARDIAQALEVSEAELLEARICEGAVQPLRRRQEDGFSSLLRGLENVGEVMCLTRNEHAVHERYGEFANCKLGKNMGLVLNREIDLRIFMRRWASGFLLTEQMSDQTTRQSMQFFDAHGVAVHKIYTTAKTDRVAFDALVSDWVNVDAPALAVTPKEPQPQDRPDDEIDAEALRADWAAMTDPHQFIDLLSRHNVGRMQALRLVGGDWAYPIETNAVTEALERAASSRVSVMIFIGSDGCIQIHTDPIENIKPMGPWINVLDEKFHMHLRQDHVAHAWIVKKPSDRGAVHSLEAYNDSGMLFFQMFGERKEGVDELEAWRDLLGALPKRN